MERQPRHGDRWSLALALIASAAIHAVPLLSALRLPYAPPMDFVVRTRSVEFGLERALPGVRPPQAQPTVTPPPSPPSSPSPSTTPAQTAPRPARPRPVTRTQSSELLPVPDLRLREPNIAPRPVRQLDPSFAARPPQEAPVRPVAATVANTAADLAPMVPQGALVTIALRTDRIRATPHGRRVRRLLGGIRDWREMLGGASLDLVDDLDRIVLAASNPFGDRGEAPDWVVLVKASSRSDRRLRAVVEAMADRDPLRRRASDETDGSEPAAPRRTTEDEADAERTDATVERTRDETRDEGRDGGARDADSTSRASFWTEREGARIATLHRYGAQRSYVLLPDGTAAIALASQLEPMLAALARRPPTQPDDGPLGAAFVLEADGVRNAIVEVPTMRGPFPLPRRATLTVTPEGAQLEAAELVARFEYDSPALARAARESWEYARGRWTVMIEALPGVAALRIGAGLLGRRSVVDHVQQAIGAIQFRASGSSVIGRVQLDEEQLRAILDAAPMLTSASR